MKVTTELKKIIERSFDEQKRQKYAELDAKIEKIITDKREEMESTQEYKNYVKAANALYNKYEKEIKKDLKERSKYQRPYYLGYMKDIENIDSNYFVHDNKDSYDRRDKERSKIYDDIEMQRESLLVRLTYEKDLDKIRNLLSQYGIVLD